MNPIHTRATGCRTLELTRVSVAIAGILRKYDNITQQDAPHKNKKKGTDSPIFLKLWPLIAIQNFMYFVELA
jgi:hypothetical protein